MRSVRSVVAGLATAVVMACQTIAGAGAAARPVSSVYPSSATTATTAQSLATTVTNETRGKNVAATDMSPSQKKTLIILAIAAVVVVAAILIGSNSNGSGY